MSELPVVNIPDPEKKTCGKCKFWFQLPRDRRMRLESSPDDGIPQSPNWFDRPVHRVPDHQAEFPHVQPL